MGRAPLVVPGPSGTLARIKDLTAVRSGVSDLALSFIKPAGLVSQEVGIWDANTSQPLLEGQPLTLVIGGVVPTALEDSKSTLVKVRWRDASGVISPWSNPAAMKTYTPGWTIRDYKSFTSLTTVGSPPSCNLDAMGAGANEALVRSAGNIVRIWGACQHGAGGTQQVTQGVATTWTQDTGGFANQAVAATQVGCRSLYKNVDGTEGIVDVFDNANPAAGGNSRTVFHAMSFEYRGTVLSMGNSVSAWSDPARPSSQTLLCGGLGPGVMAWCFHAGTVAGLPDPALVPAQAGMTDLLFGSSTTNVLFARLQLIIFPPGTAPVNLTTFPPDAGQNARLCGYDRAYLA